MTKKGEFNKLLKQVKAHMKAKDFEKAVQCYHTIDDLYKALPEEIKKKHQKDILLLFKELVLYITTNEAYYIAQHHGNLKALENQIQEVFELVHELEELPESKPLLNHIKPKFEFCLNIQEYRKVGKKFDDLYKHIESLITKGHIDTAMHEYAHLLILYHKYISYEDKDKSKIIYNKVMRLFNRIKPHKELENLYQKPIYKEPKSKPEKKIPFNPTKEELIKPQIRIQTNDLKPFPSLNPRKNITPVKPKPLPPKQDIDEYQKLKHLLKKDNLKEASKLLRKL